MRNQVIRPDDGNILLMGIRDGMSVYDNTSHKLGTVNYVQFANDTADDEILTEDVAVRNAPEPIRRRLLETGFIRFDRGLLRKDGYAPADQIDEVADNRVHLNLYREEVIIL